MLLTTNMQLTGFQERMCQEAEMRVKRGRVEVQKEMRHVHVLNEAVYAARSMLQSLLCLLVVCNHVCVW